MANYEEDNAVKLNWMVDNIRASDVIVLATNRLYGSIARLPDRYPLTTAYYELLFSEQLGFKLTGFAATYPSLLGVTLVDDTFSDPRLPVPPLLAAYKPSPLVLNLGRADESFTVYDHPKPLVFQKVRQLSAEELRALFEPAMRRIEELRQQKLAAGGGRPQGQGGGGGAGKTLLLSDADRAAAGGRRHLLRDVRCRTRWRTGRRSWSGGWRWPLLGLVALPFAFAVCRNLDDRGYFAAKSLGVLLLGYPVWLAASLHVLPYTRTSIVLVLAALAAARGLAVSSSSGRPCGPSCASDGDLVLWSEALFLVAYLRLLLHPASEPGPLAALAGRRKAHGVRLPQRHHPQHVLPALRSRTLPAAPSTTTTMASTWWPRWSS